MDQLPLHSGWERILEADASVERKKQIPPLRCGMTNKKDKWNATV